MIYLLVNIIGILFILLTLWWFFFSKSSVVQWIETNNQINILVKNGVYEPAQIHIPMGKEVTLRFTRQDVAPCSEYVIFSKLDLSQQLPLNKAVEIIIPPQAKGEIEFTCQMGMYRGRLIVD